MENRKQIIIERITCTCGEVIAGCVDGQQDERWNTDKKKYISEGFCVDKIDHSNFKFGKCECETGNTKKFFKVLAVASQLALQICAQMPTAKANKRKCAFNICTTSDGAQYLYFTVFFNDCGEETNKSLVFYEFHTQDQHTEKLERIEQYLNGEIEAKQLHDNITY